MYFLFSLKIKYDVEIGWRNDWAARMQYGKKQQQKNENKNEINGKLSLQRWLLQILLILSQITLLKSSCFLKWIIGSCSRTYNSAVLHFLRLCYTLYPSIFLATENVGQCWIADSLLCIPLGAVQFTRCLVCVMLNKSLQPWKFMCLWLLS